MDSRERTFLALDHQEPDRVPIDFWASKGFRGRLEQERKTTVREFMDHHDVDLRYIEGPSYIGPPLESDTPGVAVDIWGVPRRTIELKCENAIEYYDEVTESPLHDAETVEAVEAYPHWPSADWFDYSVIEGQCEEIRARGRVAVFMGDRLNRIAQLKPAMYICGVDKIMMNMAINPDAARMVYKKISDFYLEYTTRIMEASHGKIDIVCTGDDFGAQNGLLLSPGMWQDFIRDGFAGYIDLIHSFGAKVMHHTCGSVALLIPSLIECGLDILQSLQPEAEGMDLHELKTHYGDRLCFQGGISIQKTMPFGSPDEIRERVENIVQAFAGGGGYIFCTSHNIQADTSVDNVEALMQAYHTYGSY